MTRWLLPITLVAAAALMPTGRSLTAEDKKADLSKLPPAAAGKVDFARDIQPIIELRCVKCHSAVKESAGLRLDDGAAAVKGGNSGPAWKAGDSAGSRMIHLVAGLDPEVKMPPAGKGRALTAEEIGKLRAWIDQGAVWPNAGTAAALTVKSDHWSFQPISRPTVPAVKNAAWVRNSIDNFILSRLEAEGIAPSPAADKLTLLRRLSLDLTGLPPTPEEADAFLADRSADAYERLVDRLLESPHYGERWGRHWLDAARYADSDGYEKDTGRPFAWRYRDWVIAAVNADMPFDRFTIEQLAGDLLAGATLEQKTATGFHRNTLTNKEGGVDQEQFRVEAVVDRVNTTGKVWLGLTVGCAQCHDHKYDPISQRDYYRLFAFFNSDNEVNVPAPLAGEPEAYAKAKAAFDRKKAELEAAVKAQEAELPARQAEWEQSLTGGREPAGKSAKRPTETVPEAIVKTLAVPMDKRSAAQKAELAKYYRGIDPKLADAGKRLTDLAKTKLPTISQAQTLALGSTRKTHVLIRGDFLRPGAEVSAGTPAVLPAAAGAAPTADGAFAGRGPTRLDLAAWLVDPANPLTARVIANWTWHKHFGRGIVATPEDFGTQGERPSHPELLDWLAGEFVRLKWSMKALHRVIVTSAAYRQSAAVRSELASRDPMNVLLARQSRLRLEAELIRDTALAAGGLLTRRIGGPSVRPPQPAGVSELTYAGSARWTESMGADRYRRGMYIWFQRTSPYPMLLTFDSPDSNVCCVRRDRTNTPLQSLTLLNDPVFVEAAQALGKRIAEHKAGSTAERLAYGFRLATGRPPTAAEAAVVADLFAKLTAAARTRPEEAAKLVGRYGPAGVAPAEAAAWAAYGRMLLNLDETVTRE